MKRLMVAATVASAIALLTGPAQASANVVWCQSDPPIKVVTPAGHNLMVNNMIYIPAVDSQVQGITDDAVAVADDQGGTSITVHVYVPPQISQAHVVSAVHRYKVSASADGSGGTVITLLLDVPTA